MSRETEEEWERHLRDGLRRAEDALRKQQLWHTQMLADLTRAASDHIARSRERERERERLERERREARRRRRHERRHAELASVPLAEGFFVLISGLALFAFAAFRPYLWWLIFPAFFLVQRGIRILSARRSPVRGPEDEEAPVVETTATVSAPDERDTIDPRDARVDLVCEKIRAELRTGPAAIRELLHRPGETIDALQKTCRELTRRERELRAVLDPREDARLDAEHERLSLRLASETDPIVRQRLADAQQALDQQRRQRAELATSAARFEAEHTRISFTLESIYTQMLRARAGDAASADVAGAGLRRSLERLAVEMGAVAEALEEAHTDSGVGDRPADMPLGTGPATPESDEPPPGGGPNRLRTR